MSGIVFEGAFLRFLALLLVGWGLRWLDDGLDWPRDRVAFRPNWVRLLDRGIYVYAALALVLAVALDRETALPVFLGAYAVGMTHSLLEREPSGLARWQEILLAGLLSLTLAGPAPTVAAFTLAGALQCLDDWWEQGREADRRENWANRLGRTETLLAALSLLTVAAVFDPFLVAAGLAVLLVVHWYPRGARPRQRRSRILESWLDKFGPWEGRPE